MQCTWRGGLATLGISAALLGSAQSASAEPSPDKVAAGQLVALVNQERAAAGLPPLGLSDVAVEVAEEWSVHMAASGVLAHNDAWFSRETKERAGAAASGENVASNIDVVDAHRRLMASPHHRANILDPRFHQVGVGAVQDGSGTWWITEDFLQLRVIHDTSGIAPPVLQPPSPAPTDPPPTPPTSPAPEPSPDIAPPPVDGAATTPSSRPLAGERAGADLEDLGRAFLSSDNDDGYERLPGLAGDGIEVASGTGILAPTVQGDIAPPGLVAVAAAGILLNATGIAVLRRRRLLTAGKGGKITGS